MKKHKSVLLTRLFCTAAAAAVTVGSLGLPVPVIAQENEGISAQAETQLVNIADSCQITVPSSEGSRGPENMVDGDPSTLWVNNGAKWPCDIQFAIPAEITSPIKKVTVTFESGHSAWGVDVSLAHVVNSVVDAPIEDAASTVNYDDGFEYTFDQAISASHINLSLSNPTNNGAAGAFWPAIAEVEIWTEQEKDDTGETINVAPSAVITSVGGSAGNKGNLVDENYSTLYVFNNGGISTIQGDCWIELALDNEYEVSSMEAAFEHVANDSNNFEFTFDVYGKSRTDTDWNLLFENQTATRKTNENIVNLPLEKATKLSAVRIVVKSITSTGGDPWPALAEFKIMAKQGASEDDDKGNIAYKKPVHSNLTRNTASRVNDGNLSNTWSAERYPAYVDIDLEENYNLKDVEVFVPTNGYSRYSIYTSMDGSNFTERAVKNDKTSADGTGDVYDMTGVEARYVRLYVEYQSTSARAMVNEVRVHGEPSGTPLQEAALVNVPDYKDSGYNVTVTEADTIEEVRGIVSRRLGEQYNDWFDFSVRESTSGHDEFSMEMKDGKVAISGPNGVSIAYGLNHYLKYFCNVNISQVSDQVKMPETMPVVTDTIHQTTPLDVRYSYNFCTLSYSMAFYGEEEWRRELDWLALNGVNVVLDMTGQEEVWRRFLGELGYTHQEIKDFIAGPAYYAWFYMQNMTGFGGPVHDNWFKDRTELARKNHLIMQKLGMQPALLGFSGMVPTDIKDKDPNAQIIAQGNWTAIARPAMLKTDTESFDKYAEIFYKAQQDVYGDITKYYATDPFHEGGNTGGMNLSTVSSKVLAAMMKADSDAVWIIQSWGSNPTPALINGLGDNRDHALVLDLYAEKSPRWQNTSSYGGKEFGSTPWVYCMLNNFGGRLGLYGHVENFRKGVASAFNEAEHMTGIGITPEASVNNPVLYDMFFETAWTDSDTLEPINLEQWYKDYTTRRYGAESESAYQAMLILNDTVYNPELNMKGQGAPENVINARPAESITAASTWGNSVVDYDKAKLEQALSLLLEDYDVLRDSEGYQYDLANVAQQVISNTAQEYHKKMASAIAKGNAEAFDTYSAKFLELIDFSEEILSSQKYFLLGTWTEAAKALAEGTDDFTKNLYEMNAKALVTTWGSLDQANSGGLSDYSNRQWAGLTKDYYKPRWEKWIAEQKKRLAGEEYQNISRTDWFEMEWEFATGHMVYSNEPTEADLKALSEQILADYSVTNIPKEPEEDDSRDLDLALFTASTGSAENNSSEGPAALAIDENTSTLWHSLWAGDDRENLWIQLSTEESVKTDGLRMLPRQNGTNGIITKYRVELSNDHGATWTVAAEGTWASSSAWKLAKWEETEATDIRLYAVESRTDSSNNNYASAAEIRITGPKEDIPVVEADKTLLKQAIAYAEAISEEELNKVNELVRDAFEKALAEAKAVDADPAATQEEVNAAWNNLTEKIQMLGFTTDKTELLALIAQAEALNLDDYEEASAQALREALAYAKEVAEDPAALDEQSISAAITRLSDAMNNLVLKEELDTTLLAMLVNMVKDTDLSLYTSVGLDEFTAALAEAQTLLTSAETQGQINASVNRLNSAYMALRLKPSEEVLEELRGFQTLVLSLDMNLFTTAQTDAINDLKIRVDNALADPDLSAADADALQSDVKNMTETINQVLDQKPADENKKPAEEVKPAEEQKKPAAEDKTPASVKPASNNKSVKTAAGTGMTGFAGLAAAALGVLAGRKRRNK